MYSSCDVAAGLVAAFNANTELQALGITSSSSAAAQLAWSQSFSGNGQLAAGMNTAAISAVDGGSNTKTNLMQVSANSPSTTSLTYDANGTMTSDGTNSFAWDAENRLIKITYPGSNNFSSFVYDPLSRNVKIVETVAGSVTSTKQFIWCSSERSEERDSGGSLVKKFLDQGQEDSGTDYFYSTDAPGSIRELTDSSGLIQAQYGYNPYGQISKLQGSGDADFQYAAYYIHQRSGLNLTVMRAYSSTLARFVNRDPFGEQFGNRYAYAINNPASFVDPLGLRPLTGDEKKFVRDNFGNCLDPDKISLESAWWPKGNGLTLPSGGSWGQIFLNPYWVNRAGGLNLKDLDVAGEFAHELTHMLQFRALSDSPIGTGLGGWWTYYILGGVAQVRQLISKDAYKLPKNIDPFWTPVNILDFEKFPEAVGKSIAKPNVSDYNGIRDVLRRIRELCNTCNR